MTRARFFRKISGLRLPPREQCRANSVITCPIEHNETKNINEMQYARPTEDIPGPKALPLLGNWFRFLPYIGKYAREDVSTQLRMLRDEYGDIVKLDKIGFRRPTILLFSPELCKKMYRVEGKWPVRITMETLHYYRKNREHIYNGQYGITTSQGKAWQDIRSKVNQFMLQPRIIKVHVEQISEIASDFVERMRALRDPETLELPSDFNNELLKWALESICSTAMDCRLGCLKPNLAADSDPQIMINGLREMFDTIYRMEMQTSLWKIYNTPNLKKLFRVLDTVYEIANKHVERAKTKYETMDNSTNQRDHRILEKLLRIDKHTAQIVALDSLMAGVDTTGNVFGGLLYYIANNPEKQEKLREEVMSVLPDKTSRVTPKILDQTRYAKACIKESLRFFSITLVVLRTMQTDVCIGGYRIPAGFNVLACHSLIAQDPRQFSRTQEYIPERWLRDNTEFPSAKEAHPFASMPFGYGPRTCIGRRLAEMEMETLLLTIIRNFRIEWHHGSLEYENRMINTLVTPLRFKLIDL
ncbi:PREDICTED: cytochrome P450 CYP12A2-like [Wasmannia auropunctata]|uniref:cytochrome P450 CYP12A2-like n=1 Tax=Wasmannia auropunctata TaxID=64793 RepID=UPI0005ED5C29|nr:PREDICTED: cytochrome P450 CYP12A2-like [Wasmannia auropunctata]XP_011686056.1 PREDICTED: cytochrome P450 CYP12A2-like [Wasmannia auropunctata]XP_011686057.1 PREDICTED: cytochrome P450 CYP12A2-like [Wasmannia auropunctata]XP_011686058.1 PREDICTED: cytochrome P450 CYP12A2-like [Wasmannia auropunctata]XP_011686059.1 PREDICTED: cytochrome P450 CYP12A2-like [Wasmannia auropunctata]